MHNPDKLIQIKDQIESEIEAFFDALLKKYEPIIRNEIFMQMRKGDVLSVGLFEATIERDGDDIDKQAFTDAVFEISQFDELSPMTVLMAGETISKE